MKEIKEISKDKIFNYIKKTQKLNLNFIKYFYGIKITNKDKQNFKKFIGTIKLREKGKNNLQISEILKVSRSSISKWFCKKESIPYIIHYIYYYLELGKPKKSYQWLSINSTRGGLFIGPWIQVPKKANKASIKTFLEQFKDYKELKCDFGYLLGFTVGDASKKEIERANRTTRRLQIKLSKKFPTNKRLCDFNAQILEKLNLKMTRIKDCPAGKRNPNPFYSWSSQSSMLVQWIFQVCLGLENHEKTTYNAIRAEWIRNMSRKFKIGFLQGLADSDGFVDFSAHQVGIIAGPNLELVSKVLKDLKIKHRRWYLVSSKIWSVVISIKDAYKLPIFSPKVKSYRFEETKLLFKAKRIKGKWPKWLNKKIEKEINKGFSGTKLVRKILKEENIAIRPGGIRDKKKRMEKRKKIIILGIECTAL